MAIHAKSNGWLIAGKIISESQFSLVFHATDEKRPKVIAKGDTKNCVFDGDTALKDAEEWQSSRRQKMKLSSKPLI